MTASTNFVSFFSGAKKKGSLCSFGVFIINSAMGFLLLKYWVIPSLWKLFFVIESKNINLENNSNSIGAILTLLFFLSILVCSFISIFKELKPEGGVVDGAIAGFVILGPIIGLILGLFLSYSKESVSIIITDFIKPSIIGFSIGFLICFVRGIKIEFIKEESLE